MVLRLAKPVEPAACPVRAKRAYGELTAHSIDLVLSNSLAIEQNMVLRLAKPVEPAACPVRAKRAYGELTAHSIDLALSNSLALNKIWFCA